MRVWAEKFGNMLENTLRHLQLLPGADSGSQGQGPENKIGDGTKGGIPGDELLPKAFYPDLLEAFANVHFYFSRIGSRKIDSLINYSHSSIIQLSHQFNIPIGLKIRLLICVGVFTKVKDAFLIKRVFSFLKYKTFVRGSFPSCFKIIYGGGGCADMG